MNNISKLERVASGITEQSILNYIELVEPVYLGMKNAYSQPTIKAKSQVAAQVLIDNNLI